MGLLKGKRALVTGGARGIGRAIVEKFIQEGANVTVVDIAPDKGWGFPQTELDISDRRQVDDFIFQGVECIDELFYPRGELFDIVVNNAAAQDPIIIPEYDIGWSAARILWNEIAATWDKVVETNLTGHFYISSIVAKGMINWKRPGSIIFITSGHTAQAYPNCAAYDASKHGIVGLMRVLAVKLGQYGIRVNAVAPGAILAGVTALRSPEERTEFAKRIPLGGRIGKPEEIAEVVAFLASNKASYVTGAEWRVDGGLSIRNALL